MQIDHKLNLTFPVDDFIVHHMPISYAQYKSVAETLAATTARMLRKGLFFSSTQHDVVIHSYNAVVADDDNLAGNDPFISELIRLTSIIKKGEVIMMYDALHSGEIDEEKKDYILSEILFFILSCRRLRNETKEKIAQGIAADTRNGMETTSYTATELCQYLPTLTATEDTATNGTAS
jgi:hypothetical protein